MLQSWGPEAVGPFWLWLLAQKGIRTIVLDQAQGPPKGLRGEIFQPNGQQVLDRLGVLPSLPPDATRAVRMFHFYRAGGTRLCSIDYGDLPPRTIEPL